MKVTMVKKRLSSGEECRKCAEATEFLKSKGVFDNIDDVVWYDENDPESQGAVLARTFDMERAPFFVVERAGRDPEAVDSVMRAYRML